jgi:DNA-directed RNA polymerase specialized sigma24 family protein
MSREITIVEMLGRYSHLSEQGELLDDLLEMVPEGSPEAFPRPPKRILHRLNSQEIGELLAGYAAGTKIADLANRFHVDHSTVQKYARGHSLPRRLKRLDANRVEDVIRLYSNGRSVESVAEYMEVAPTSVRRALAKAGVPIRKRGRPKLL